jgi:hypothetical protein
VPSRLLVRPAATLAISTTSAARPGARSRRRRDTSGVQLPPARPRRHSARPALLPPDAVHGTASTEAADKNHIGPLTLWFVKRRWTHALGRASFCQCRRGPSAPPLTTTATVTTRTTLTSAPSTRTATSFFSFYFKFESLLYKTCLNLYEFHFLKCFLFYI